MKDYWINGTDGRSIQFNGCSKYHDCFSCIFDECYVSVHDCIEQKHERVALNREQKITNQKKHEYYLANRTRILENQRKYRERKRQDQRLQQQAVG